LIWCTYKLIYSLLQCSLFFLSNVTFFSSISFITLSVFRNFLFYSLSLFVCFFRFFPISLLLSVLPSVYTNLCSYLPVPPSSVSNLKYLIYMFMLFLSFSLNLSLLFIRLSFYPVLPIWSTFHCYETTHSISNLLVATKTLSKRYWYLSPTLQPT